MVNNKALQTMVVALGFALFSGEAMGQLARHACSDNPAISTSTIQSMVISGITSPNCGGSDTGELHLTNYEIPGCRGCRHRLTFTFRGRVEVARVSATHANAPDSFGVGIGPRYSQTGTVSWAWNGSTLDTNSPCSGITYTGLQATYDYRGGDFVLLAYLTRDGLNHNGFFTQIDSVSVQTFDEHGDIVFDVENLNADGKSKAHPRLTSPNAYPFDVLAWTIVGESEEETLGCTINPTTGEITAGEVPGKIIVRAYNTEIPGCFIEAELKVGCEPCETADCLFGGTAKVGSVELLITAGKASFGDMAGVFRIKEEYPSAILSTPQALKYFIGGMSTNEVGVLKTNDYVRQVFTPQTLANVVSNSPLEYQIEFYAPGNYGTQTTNGLYPISGSPFTTWVIKNPNGSSTNELSVLEISGSRTNTFEYAWDSIVQGWELTDDNGNRKQKRWSTTNGMIRTETYLVRNAANQVKYQEVKKFETFDWGEEIIEQVVGTGSTALTNTYSYYTSTNSADADYSRLQREIEPGGRWTQYTYHTTGRPLTVIKQFLDSPIPSSLAQALTNHVTTNVFYLNAIETYEKLNGIETEWSVQIFNTSYVENLRKQSATTPNNNLTEGRWSYLTEPFIGLPQKIRHEDATWTFFFYTNSASGDFRTNTVDRGQGNGTTATAVTNGTRTVTVVDRAGNRVSEKGYDISSGLLISSEVVTSNDVFGRPLVIQFLDGTTETYVYGCCGLESFTDREGITEFYDYDNLKRRYYVNRGGIATREEYDANGRVERRVRIGRDSSEIVLESFTYDDADRKTSSTAPPNGSGLNRTTTYSEAFDGNNHLVKTTTFPDGGTEVRTFFQDGSLLSVSGTAAYPRKFEYGIEKVQTLTRTNRFTKEIRLGPNGEQTEWTKRYTDALNRVWKTIEADGSASTSTFRADIGKLENQIDYDSVTNWFFYNGKGEFELFKTQMSNSGSSTNRASLDRFTQTISDVISNANGIILRARTFVWPTNSNGTALLTRTVEQTANGLKTWDIRFGLTNETRIDYVGNGNKIITNIAPDGSYAVMQFTNGFKASVTHYSAGNAVLTSESYSYDSHGRLRFVTDLRNGTATLLFNDSDSLYSIATPAPGAGLSAQTNTFQFDENDRVRLENFADGTSRTNEFYFTGDLFRIHGSRQYPVEFSYDAQGRKKTMTTWQDFADTNTAAITTWNYDSQRGWLNSVRDHNDKGETYARTAGGRLKTVVNARGLSLTNSYNVAGDLTNVVFSDSLTPRLSFSYNRLAQPTNIIQTLTGQFTNTTVLTYNSAGRVTRESHTSGILSGRAVTNGFDSLLRRSAVAVDGYSMTHTRFSYGDASRLLTVSNDVNSVTYAYLENSDLIESTTFKNNGTTRMTTIRAHDFLNRLTSISSSPSSSFSYQHNNANQRTNVTLADGSFWHYKYDSLGQLTSGKRYWTNSTPVMGQQFEYSFDGIGNRTTNKWGGTEFGTGLRTATYSPNLLNQYTNKTNPGTFDIIGDANSNALVTVNFEDTERHGEYFWKELFANNASAPVLVTLTNIAVLLGGTNADIVATNVGSLLLAKASENLTFDLDGNLTSNSLWTNTWNALNQLTSMQSQNAVPANIRLKLDFVYDYLGRRIRKIVSVWNGSTYVTSYTNKFIYDGWNLIARLDGGDTLLQSFVWAGNIPFSITDYQTGTAGTYFYVHDGNRNVVALTSATDGSKAAEYNYNPFGGILGMTGLMAYANPLRFSSEYHDDETDLVYYIFRYYDPGTGRWWSRDPIREEGGLNLYGFVGNDSVSGIDYLGLYDGIPWGDMGMFQGHKPTSPPPNVGRIINGVLEATVPGQVSWNNAMNNFWNGNPAAGASWLSFYVSEVALYIATLGTSKYCCKIPRIQSATKVTLTEGEVYLVVIKNDEVITTSNVLLGHKDFLKKLCIDPAKDKVWVGTIVKDGKKIIPLNSKSIYDNQNPAPKAVQDIINKSFQ